MPVVAFILGYLVAWTIYGFLYVIFEFIPSKSHFRNRIFYVAAYPGLLVFASGNVGLAIPAPLLNRKNPQLPKLRVDYRESGSIEGEADLAIRRKPPFAKGKYAGSRWVSPQYPHQHKTNDSLR